MQAPATLGASGDFAFISRGATTTVQQKSAIILAPATRVVSGLANLATPATTVRVNGVAANSSTSQGGGNFGTYPLYIGRRGGTTLPFNGSIYQLIVRAAASTAAQVAQAEAYVGAKAGISL